MFILAAWSVSSTDTYQFSLSAQRFSYWVLLYLYDGDDDDDDDDHNDDDDADDDDDSVGDDNGVNDKGHGEQWVRVLCNLVIFIPLMR